MAVPGALQKDCRRRLLELLSCRVVSGPSLENVSAKKGLNGRGDATPADSLTYLQDKSSQSYSDYTITASTTAAYLDNESAESTAVVQTHYSLSPQDDWSADYSDRTESQTPAGVSTSDSAHDKSGP
jgi:hypothetical protein